jgi:hypothetical protein
MTVKELYDWAIKNKCEDADIIIQPHDSLGFEITEENITEVVWTTFGNIVDDKVVISE